MKSLKVEGEDARGLSGLVRPRYSPGLLLEDEDLTAGVDYTRELNRLLFRSLFGCGVICGLTVRAEYACNNRKLAVHVDPGVALDARGDAIALNRPVTLVYDPECADFPPEIWVEICRTEAGCRTRDVSCAGHGQTPVGEPTRLRDGYEIKLHAAQPDCSCGAVGPPARPKTPRGACCGHEEETAGQAATGENAGPYDPYKEHREGVCGCACGCSCVLLARIRLRDEDGWLRKPVSDGTVARRIRPMLIGDPTFGDLLQRARPASTVDADPGVPAPADAGPAAPA